MIRFLEQRDIPRLRELEAGYDWTFERDYLCALAIVDENDRPVMIAGAWKRAETHMVTDHQWATPQVREAALTVLHDAMAKTLAKEGVAEVVTWFDGMKALQRRLKRLGWDMAKRTMWARRLF